MPDVMMPQMGESIAEGTIVRWIKKVGERVDRDEPLFEISTDKVDAEIPSPSAGVLTEIRAKEGETVAVNTVVAVIGAPAGAAGPAPAAPRAPAQADGTSAPAAREEPTAAGETVQAAAPPAAPAGTEPESAEAAGSEERRQRSSPLVRKIAREHNVDLARVTGTGIGGRVTKDDILQYVERGAAAAPARAGEATPAAEAQAPPPDAPAPQPESPAFRPGENVEIVPMSVMRRKIAEHMIMSRRTSAHVHSVFEVDFTRVARVRERRRAEFERVGAKLTYMAFITKAAADALRAVPIVNASIDGDRIVYKKDINIGIAVALDWGLIVPVIKGADEKNLLGLTRAIADLAERARHKKLKPEEVLGGTFSITNPGVFGALFGMPIISQPQVAIMGIGAIEKRPVVVDDMIAVRPRAYLSLGYDHRLIDGAVADQFMAKVKKSLEEWEDAEL